MNKNYPTTSESSKRSSSGICISDGISLRLRAVPTCVCLASPFDKTDFGISLVIIGVFFKPNRTARFLTSDGVLT